jgi:hypothetical protein
MATTITAGTTTGTAFSVTPDTSGNLAFQTQAGANTITVPNATATLLSTRTAGTILQVVQSTLTTNVNPTSSTFITTGLSVTITPSASTNKILLNVSGGSMDTGGTGQIVATIYKNGTNLMGSGALATVYGSARVAAPVAINYLDSPATTSAITYTVYVAASSGSCYFNSTAPGGVAQTTTLTATEVVA